MRKTSIQILFRLFSFLSDKTNGFRLFSNYKLTLGALLISISVTSCSNDNKPVIANDEKPDDAEKLPTCYMPPAPQSEPDIIQKDTIISQVTVIKEKNKKEKVEIISPNTAKIEPKTSEVMCYYPSNIPFIDHNENFKQFLMKNIRYPQAALEYGIQGRVYIGFTVSKTGEITDVEVRRSVHRILDEEAIRVISSMPKWIPGKQNGNPIEVKYVLPVTFRIKE
jgi:protein TonB